MVKAKSARNEAAKEERSACNEDQMLEKVNDHQVVEMAVHLIALRVKFVQFLILVSEVFDEPDHNNEPHEGEHPFGEGLWVFPVEFVLANPFAAH
jgi:hypothetical protein